MLPCRYFDKLNIVINVSVLNIREHKATTTTKKRKTESNNKKYILYSFILHMRKYNCNPINRLGSTISCICIRWHICAVHVYHSIALAMLAFFLVLVDIAHLRL